MFAWFNAASTFASPSKRANFLNHERNFGQDLDCDFTIKLHISNPMHLAHVAFAQLGGDAIVRDEFANHLSSPTSS